MESTGSLLGRRLHAGIFVAGVGVSNIGDFIYLVAINILVLERTHSPAIVGGLWILGPLASFLVGPIAGSVTDRLPRRMQLIVYELIRGLLVACLPIAHGVFLMYSLVFLLGVAETMFNNVFRPYQTMLFAREQQKQLNSWISMLQSTAILVGPAIAGLLLQIGSVNLPLWIDAISFLLSAFSFLLLPNVMSAQTGHADLEKAKAGWGGRIRADWSAAMAFLKSNMLYTAVWILTSFIWTFGMTADSQEVVFATNALHLGKLGFAEMVTAAGAGNILGAFFLTFIAKRLKTVWLIGIGTLYTFGYLIYSFAQGFWMAVFGLIVLGLFGTAATVGIATYAQHTVPVEMMGRINNVLSPPRSLFRFIMPLVGGYIATVYSVRSMMVSMTVLMCILAVMMAVIVFIPKNRVQVLQVDEVTA